jgi:hypothetical protein
MRRLSLVATAVGALALTASAMAQNPPAQQPGRQGAPPPAAPAQKPPSEMTASGTVVKYDPVTRMLPRKCGRDAGSAQELPLQRVAC